MESVSCRKSPKSAINALNKQGTKPMKNKGLKLMALTGVLAAAFAFANDNKAVAQDFSKAKTELPVKESARDHAREASREGIYTGFAILRGKNDTKGSDEYLANGWEKIFNKHGVNVKVFVERGVQAGTLYAAYIKGSTTGEFVRMNADDLRREFPTIISAQKGLDNRRALEKMRKAEASTIQKPTIEN